MHQNFAKNAFFFSLHQNAGQLFYSPKNELFFSKNTEQHSNAGRIIQQTIKIICKAHVFAGVFLGPGSFFFVVLGSFTFLAALPLVGGAGVSWSSEAVAMEVLPSSPLSWTELEEEGVGVVEGGGGVSACACCDATRSRLSLGFLVLKKRTDYIDKNKILKKWEITHKVLLILVKIPSYLQLISICIK